MAEEAAQAPDLSEIKRQVASGTHKFVSGESQKPAAPNPQQQPNPQPTPESGNAGEGSTQPAKTPPEEQKPVETQAQPEEQKPENTPAEAGTNIDDGKTDADPEIDQTLLRISDGEIKSASDLKSLISQKKTLSDLESRINAMEAENTQLKAQTSIDPFANDYVRKLNDLQKSGASQQQIDAFITLNKVGELNSLEPYEAKKLTLMLKHKLNGDEADAYIRRNYKLDSEEYSEAEVNADKIQLKVDADNDIEYLEKYKAQISEVPRPPSQQEIQAQQETYVKKIEPVIKGVAQDLTSIKGVSVNGKRGDEAQTIDLNISDSSRSELDEALTQFAVQNQLQNDETGKQALKEFGEAVLAVKNWRNWLIDVAAKTEARVREEYHNPSTISRGADNPAPAEEPLSKAKMWVARNG